MKNLSKISFIIFAITGTITAQSFYTNYVMKGTSLDINPSASQIGSGESSVANNFIAGSYFSNPAAIASKGGIHFFFNERKNDWNTFFKNMAFQSFGTEIRTSFGAIVLAYHKYSSGDLEYVSPLWSVASETQKDINNTFIIGFAGSPIKGFSVGASTKIFNKKRTSTLGVGNSLESNSPILIDLGILYTFDSFISSDSYSDQLNIGGAIQNFGTDYEQNEHIFNQGFNKVKLPRFARIGFAYKANMVLGSKVRAETSLIFSGEYKNLLNPGNAEGSMRDYWNFGIEAGLLKTLYLRLGAVNSPEKNILYDSKKFLLRYGAGINIPFLGSLLGMPVDVEFNYSLTEINDISLYNMDGSQMNGKTSLSSFGVSININRKIL
jgi:hypothetical protein